MSAEFVSFYGVAVGALMYLFGFWQGSSPRRRSVEQERLRDRAYSDGYSEGLTAGWRHPNPGAEQRCPVCEGRGFVPAGFYTGYMGSTNPDVCRRCGGQGTYPIPGLEDNRTLPSADGESRVSDQNPKATP